MCETVERYAERYAEKYVEKAKKENLIQIAKKLIARGNSVDSVVEVTSLSMDEVLELQSNM